MDYDPEDAGFFARPQPPGEATIRTGEGEMEQLNSSGRFKVAVVGDFMEDVYWIGEAQSLSAEVPIPVVKVKERKIFPGGAGNVAANLAALGVHCMWFGNGGPQKNRLMVGDHQLARWDEYDECRPAMGLDRLQDDFDAIVVSDYGKGSITDHTISCIRVFRDLPIFVDTKRDPSVWSGVATAIFPNAKELDAHMESYVGFNGIVVRKMGAGGLALYPKGLRYFGETTNPDREICSSSQARFIRSVNGAGDSVLAAFVYAYLRAGEKDSIMSDCPYKWEHILGFANAAAACAVEHPYTYAPTLEEVPERYAGF